MSKGLFVVISGPSAVGKTSVVQALLPLVPDSVRLVTMTSRPPRPGEVEGRDYFFVTRPEFEERIKQGDLLEWAESYGNLYGSSRSKLEAMRASHRVVVAVIDYQGARSIVAAVPDCVTVFLEPGSIDELRRRLVEREGSETPAVTRRLARVAEEMVAAESFQYRFKNPDGHLDDTVADLVKLVERLAQ